MVAIIRRPTRALTAVEPFYRPVSLLDEMERMARDIWESWPVTFSTNLTPRMDMYEDKEGLVIKAEFPGVKKKDLNISLEGDVLTIKAEKKQEKVAEEATYYSCERCFGQYTRRLSLPFHADAEQISATFKDGLLKLRLPKAEEAKSKPVKVKVR
ncbi:MAG: Hsp20/alpha crystallin family protein [Dehalococcoidales bacterium]